MSITQPASGPAGSGSLRPSSSPPGAITTYSHTTFLTTLTARFTDSLLDATKRAQGDIDQTGEGAPASLLPEYYVEATKAALRAVLTQQYSPEIAQAYSNAWNTAGAEAAPAPAPKGGDAQPAATTTEKKKPIRTYIGPDTLARGGTDGAALRGLTGLLHDR
jgi:hypothetical protein